MSRIIVKNLPTRGVEDSEIKNHFADIDNVTDVKLKYNELGVFRRFAFVGFKSEDAAERAIQKLNNTLIKNSKIVLEPCKSIKEIKPDKFEPAGKRKQGVGAAEINNDLEGGTDHQAKKRKKNKGKEEGKNDVFEEYSHDPEFEEYLDLQRNIGEKSTTKQIWSDDIQINLDKSSKTGPKVKEVEISDAQVDLDSKPRKRHKRSRGKKKSKKTKPKEFFPHTIKIKGFTDRKEVEKFFKTPKPLELLSIRLNKDNICYVAFKNEDDLKFAMRKNLQFWGTSKIQMWRHDVTKSRLFKENAREKIKEKEITFKKYETSMADTEPIEESGRLFVRNLDYSCSQEDLEQVFLKYGECEIHICIDKATSLSKGLAFVEFMFPKDAVRAFNELNGTIFQGRNFHLIPAKPKSESIQNRVPFSGPYQVQPSSFKRDKMVEQQQSAPKGANWNILFLNPNAVADEVSGRKGVDKSILLTQQTRKDPIAVRMALGDASVVEETRKFLVSNGIELDSFDNPQAPRSRTVMIAKNLPAATDRSELSNLFELYGRVSRVIMPPNGLSAIIEMEETGEAKSAFRKLAYSKFKDTLLYLEWAPVNVFREKCLDEQERTDLEQLKKSQTGSKIVVKNVPFEANLQELKKIFAAYGELNFVRMPEKIDGQHRGFGFVDYTTKEDALRAFRSLCHSTHLYGRKLVLEWAKADDSSNADKIKL